MKKIVVLCLALIFTYGFASDEPLGFVVVSMPIAEYHALQVRDTNTMPRGIRARWETNQRRIAQAQATADLALEEIAALNRALNQIQEAQRNIQHTQRRMAATLHTMSPARLEESEIQLAYLTEAFQDLYSRVAAIQLLPIIQQTQRTPVRPRGFTVSDATINLSGDEFADFSRGLEAFRRRFYAEARQVLRLTIQRFPQGKFTDRANFWIAEAYFMERNYTSALTYYENVLGFSGSSKQDDAQYKIALSYRNMGELDMAFNEFRRLIHRFPASEWVVPANEAILEIVMMRNMRAIADAAAQAAVDEPTTVVDVEAGE
ncbi:MAG: outer membrane protein assembly factor BamD [Chitinivibrionia bacterium]|nr:outer membrane protein assembly factor BamD [Chitinivibrionia bacterium]